MGRFFLSLIVGALVFLGCKGSEHPGSNGGDAGNSGNPPPLSSGIAGVWTGSEGSVQNKMTPTARLEITEDAGVVFAVWYSSKIFPDAGDWPVGSLYGFRDGGTLFLRNAAELLPDGGLQGGTQFKATITGSHLEGVDQRVDSAGAPLPIYLKVDRVP
jgi:hypothetical protein